MNATTERRQLRLETDVRTIVERWGDAGPAVLCVHGIGSSRLDFARLGEALSSTHRVFAYDQRGHGESGAHDAAMDLGALANDLRAVADAIGTVAVVVGHSWGGAVALVGGPRIAASLVLVDPLLRIPPRTFDADYVDDLAPVLALAPGAERESAIRAMFADADARDREMKVHALATARTGTLHRLGRHNHVDAGGWDLRERLAALRVPATILVAGDDSVIAADDIARVAPQVRVEHVAGHGHTLHRTAPEVLAEAVRAAADA